MRIRNNACRLIFCFVCVQYQESCIFAHGEGDMRPVQPLGMRPLQPAARQIDPTRKVASYGCALYVIKW